MQGNRARRTHPDNAWRRGQALREGFTTSACAAAAACAAVRALVNGAPVDEVTIDLPARRGVTFRMSRCQVGAGQTTCGTIKDAGDDPDVTHGAEIVATAEWTEAPGVQIAGGEGVGVVTKPGLAVPVGEPAINPGPRQLIARVVEAEAGAALADRGLRITIGVPGGAALAQQTANPRLGIAGGISILGTTGIVKPYSQGAYRASIYVELKVAASNAVTRAVLATGNRSEAYAAARYPDWPALSFVQVGDHVGYALRQVRRLGFESVVVAGMIGKLSKLAQGRMQTHVSEGEIDLGFLAQVAADLGAGAELAGRIGEANTAHHVQLMLREAGILGLERRLAEMAAEQLWVAVDGGLDVEVLLYDMKGTLLGECGLERRL